MAAYSFQGRKRVWKPRSEEENRTIFSARKQDNVLPSDQSDTSDDSESTTIEDKWDVKRTMRLLRFYGAHRCLWDVGDLDNRNRKLRKAALVDIAAAMGDDITVDLVVRKINVLRATYRYEKRRIKQRMRKGIGARTKLKWFALADAFLRHVPRSNKQRKKKNADSDSDLEDSVVFSIDPESLISLEEEDVVEIKECRIDNSANTITSEMFVTTLNTEDKTHRNKTIWTAQESLQFVNLLREYPELWQSSLYFSADMEHKKSKALQTIADHMQLPLEFICRQLHIFRRTYDSEKMQMALNPSYRSNLVWWPLAEGFLERVVEKNNDLDNFIDMDKLPPATPMMKQIYSAGSADDQHEADKSLWNGLEDNLLEGKWSLKYSVKFLRLYGAHRCLWDLNDPDYRSRDLRAAAIEDIAAAMGHGLDADFVAKKIKIFRITYMQHRKRMLEALKQGLEPQIQLRWFPLADSFLRPHIGLRSIKAGELEMPQFDYQSVVANLNMIDPALLTDFRGKGTQNTIEIGTEAVQEDIGEENNL